MAQTVGGQVIAADLRMKEAGFSNFLFGGLVEVGGLYLLSVDWNPDGLVASAFTAPGEQQEALSVTVGHPDWMELDRGTLTLAAAIERAQARTSLSPDGIARIYANLCTSLLALPATMEAMHRARAQGVPIYILSNMQVHAWRYLESTFDCWQACEGVVVSCEAGHIKPEPAIYQHLCDKFSVTPESCIFVDDMAENIDAARAFGMQGVQLTDKHAGGELVDELAARIIAGRR